MKVVPEGRSDAVQFFQSHIAKWIENADQIGSNPEEMAALQDKINDARDAYTAQLAAQGAAVAATAAFNQMLDELRIMGSCVIGKIHATARIDGNGIYSLAQIPPPSKPAPVAPPGQPSNFAFHIDGDGSLKLTWKCKNPRNSSGTTYKIERQIGLAGDFVYVGQAGTKRYTDSTVPIGTSNITYRITAMRSTALGPCADFNVTFGGGIPTPQTQNIQLANPRRLRRAA